MHVFEDYRAPDDAAVVDLVRRYPFAAVVSTAVEPAGPVPEATHVPVVPDPGADVSDGLEGAQLWGHMARANPQWRRFAAGARVLVMFSGPHGYVSPTAYGTSPAVPTWNYAAVHAVGRVALVEDPEASLRVITATVEALEGAQPEPWPHDGSLEHFRRILRGIVSFTVDVESVEAVFKMSQDKPDALYQRVHARFSAAGDADAAAVAAAMAASNPARHCPVLP